MIVDLAALVTIGAPLIFLFLRDAGASTRSTLCATRACPNPCAW